MTAAKKLRKRVTFTREQNQEITRRYEAGEPSTVLGREFGVSRFTICKLVKRNGYNVINRHLADKVRHPRVERTEKREGASWKLTEAQKDEIFARYAAGESSVALARAYGVLDGGIRSIIKRRGGVMRNCGTRHGPAVIKRICDMYAAGEKVLVIAMEVGVSEKSISRIARRNGLPARSLSPIERMNAK